MSEQICKKIPKLQSGDVMYPRPGKNKMPPRKRFQERSPFNDDLPKERHKILKKLQKGGMPASPGRPAQFAHYNVPVGNKGKKLVKKHQQGALLQGFDQWRQTPEGKFQFENMERNRIAKKSSGRIDYSDVDPITDIAMPLVGVAGTVGRQVIKQGAKQTGQFLAKNIPGPKTLALSKILDNSKLDTKLANNLYANRILEEELVGPNITFKGLSESLPEGSRMIDYHGSPYIQKDGRVYYAREFDKGFDLIDRTDDFMPRVGEKYPTKERIRLQKKYNVSNEAAPLSDKTFYKYNTDVENPDDWIIHNDKGSLKNDNTWWRKSEPYKGMSKRSLLDEPTGRHLFANQSSLENAIGKPLDEHRELIGDIIKEGSLQRGGITITPTSEASLPNITGLKSFTYNPVTKSMERGIFSGQRTTTTGMVEWPEITGGRMRSQPSGKTMSVREDINPLLLDINERLNSAEGQRRLSALGRSPNNFRNVTFKTVDDASDPASLIHKDGKVTIKLNKNILKEDIRNITRHEIEHVVQNQRQSPLDLELSDLELKKYHPDLRDPSNPHNQILNYSGYYRTEVGRPISSRNYFLYGSGGREKSAMLSELQQHLLDTKQISHPYATKEITPELMERAYNANKEKIGGYPMRILSIIEPTQKNFGILANSLNKMFTGAGVAAGLGKTIKGNTNE